MTKGDIFRMAQEAGGGPTPPDFLIPVFVRFADLIASAEREACAQFIEHEYVRQFERPWRVDLSAAIRARGQA